MPELCFPRSYLFRVLPYVDPHTFFHQCLSDYGLPAFGAPHRGQRGARGCDQRVPALSGAMEPLAHARTEVAQVRNIDSW